LEAKITFLTHSGLVRTNNEDAFSVFSRGSSHFENLRSAEIDEKGLFLLVADGMGGANAGEIAADIAVTALQSYLSSTDFENDEEVFMKTGLWEAHKEILSRAFHSPELRGMGTTAVLLWLKSDFAHISWCGDSRCYLLRDNELSLLTDDHTLVNEHLKNGLIEKNSVANHPQRHVLTQVLGDESGKVFPGYSKISLSENDLFLLCSDGLNSMLEDDKIAEICRKDGNITQNLLNAALSAGGSDNITLICASIKKKARSGLNLVRFALLAVSFLILTWSVKNLSFCESEKSKSQENVVFHPEKIEVLDTSEQFSDLEKLNPNAKTEIFVLMQKNKDLQNNVTELLFKDKANEIELRELLKTLKNQENSLKSAEENRKKIGEKKFAEELKKYAREISETERRIEKDKN
jgi:protein phosphatase